MVSPAAEKRITAMQVRSRSRDQRPDGCRAPSRRVRRRQRNDLLGNGRIAVQPCFTVRPATHVRNCAGFGTMT